MVLDRFGTVLQINPTGLRMLETEDGSAIAGKPFEPLIEEEYRETFRRAHEAVFAGRDGESLEFAVRGLRGGERILETNLAALRGDDGTITGALALSRDVTVRKHRELRDAFLVRLDDEIRPLIDPAEITQTAARLLCEHLRADRCSYAEIDIEKGQVDVLGNYTPNLPPIIGRYPLHSFGDSFLSNMSSGRAHIFRDSARELPEDAQAAYAAMHIAAIIAVPILKHGRLVAGLGVHQSTPRDWRDDEVDLVRITGHRCWESIERGRVERALRVSEETFRTLANAIPTLAWMGHPDGHLFWYNQRWYDYTGATQEEMAGWGWQKVHDPAVLPEVMERWKRSLALGERFEMAFPLRGADGQSRTFLTQVEPIRDERGRVLRWFGTNTDITAQQEAEQREKKARRTAELLNRIGPTLAAELDEAKLTQKITEIATRAVGAEVGMFSPDGDSGEGAPAGWNSYLSVPVRSRSGTTFGRLVFGHPQAGMFTEENASIAQGIAAQAAIALDNASLFKETRRSGEALRRTNEDLTRVNEDLNQFAYSASHDLLEPMRMVSIYTQLLKRSVQDRLSETELVYMQYVLRGAARMEALVKDLLAYTRAVAKAEGEIALVDANEALRQALTNLSAAVEESQALITCAELPQVRIAEVHLTQVFQNLIGNALKYRSAEAPEVRIACERRESDWIFSIADNGIGIEPQYGEQIFGIFTRLHSDGEYAGTGIGLAICQRVVQRAGGKIWVESEPGRGSTFLFTLPAVD